MLYAGMRLGKRKGRKMTTTERVELVKSKNLPSIEESEARESESSEQIVLFTSEGAQTTDNSSSAESSSESGVNATENKSITVSESENVSTSGSESNNSTGVSAFGNPAEGQSSGDILTLSSISPISEPEKAKKAEEERKAKEKEENEKKKAGFIKQALSCVKNKEKFEGKNLENDLEKLYYQLKDVPFTKKPQLVAEFLKEKNIEVDDSELKALIEGYIKYETMPDDIAGLNILYSKNLSRSEANKVARLMVGIHSGKVAIDKNDRGGQILKAFCSNIEAGNLVDEEKYTELLTDYIYARSRVEDLSELEKLDARFIEQTDTKFILPQVKNEYEKYTACRLLTPEKVAEQREIAAKAKAKIFECMLFLARNKDEKKSIYRTQEKSIKSTQKRFTELTEEFITKEHTKEQAEQILEEAGKYTEEQAKRIAASLEINGMDEDFKAEMHFKLQKSIKYAKEYTIKFIQKFFESEKGRAILNYTRQRAQEVHEKKIKLEEAKKESEKASEEAKVAQNEAEKAMYEAKKEEKKATELAENFGLKDLTFDKLFKFAKNVSTELAYNLLYSQENKKKAREAEIDAGFAKERAYSQEKVARMNLAVARAQMQAAMINAQTNLFIAMSRS